MQARELIRLPNWIRIEDAIVNPNQEYWFLKRLEYQDDTLSGGLHHIFVQDPHDITQQARVRGGSETWAVKLEKPQNEPAGNFPMFGGITYSCEMEGLPSDRVEGMHLPSKHHVNYILTYEKRRKSNLPLGGGGTDTDDEETTTTTGQGTRTLPQVLIHRGDAAQVLEFNKNAALQKVIFRDGFVPNSPEFTLRHDGKAYLGQRAENLATAEVRIYYCEMGHFDRVQFVKK